VLLDDTGARTCRMARKYSRGVRPVYSIGTIH
jgi:hypothetical protein